jgi:hypothetical protein
MQNNLDNSTAEHSRYLACVYAQTGTYRYFESR